MKNLIAAFLTLFVVNNLSAETYYFNGTGTATSILSWGVNENGTGAIPACFCGSNVYILTNTESVVLDNILPWTFSGQSVLEVGNPDWGNTTLEINGQGLGGVRSRISVRDGSTLVLNGVNLSDIEFASLDNNGTVEFKGGGNNFQGEVEIPEADYGNLVVSGVSSSEVKTFPDDMNVRGTLLLNSIISPGGKKIKVNLEGDIHFGNNFSFEAGSDEDFEFVFEGDADQEIVGFNNSIEVKKFKVEKTGGEILIRDINFYIDNDFKLKENNICRVENGQFWVKKKTEIPETALLEIGSSGTFVAQKDVKNNGVIRIHGGANPFTQGGAFHQLSGSDYSGSGAFLTGNNVGYTPFSQYTYWSSPIEEGSLTFFPQVGYNYYYEDMSIADEGWKFSSTEMEPGRGYALNEVGGDEIIFSGKPNNGDVSGPMAGIPDGQTEGWSFVGNPYPGPLHTAEFLEANPQINGAVYIWDQSSFVDQWGFGTEDYSVVNGTGNIWVGRESLDTIDITNFWISPFQGFFVEGFGSPAPVSFSNDMRSPELTTNEEWTFKIGGEKQKLWFQLRRPADQVKTEALLGFLPNATEDWDRLYDARPNEGAFGLASLVGDEKAVIQGLPQFTGNEIVRWVGTFDKVGEYQFYFDRSSEFEGEVWLKDDVLDEVVKLELETPYSFFQSETGARNFTMYFMDPGVIGVDENGIASRTFLQTNKDGFTALEKGQVRVFDLGGKLIQDYSIGKNESIRPTNNQGVFIVHFENQNGSEVIKWAR